MSKNRLWTLLPLTTLPTFCVTSCWNINKEIDSIKRRVDESSYYVSKYKKNNLVEGKNIVFNKLAKPKLSHEDDKYYAKRKKEVDDYLKNNFFDATINNRNFVDPKTYGANDINYYDLWKKGIKYVDQLKEYYKLFFTDKFEDCKKTNYLLDSVSAYILSSVLFKRLSNEYFSKDNTYEDFKKAINEYKTNAKDPNYVERCYKTIEILFKYYEDNKHLFLTIITHI